MMKVILYLYDQCAAMVKKGQALSSILATGIFAEVNKIKYDVPNDRLRCWTTTTVRSTGPWPPWHKQGGTQKYESENCGT